jgi:Zn-finger nucleic acid-binding protein
MPAEAETLNCPMCGAPATTDATQCEHCGARLATVACPSCFGLIFLGAKFCSHCGAKVTRVETDAKIEELCPRCKIDLQAIKVGKTNLRECPKCEGLWVDMVSFQEICSDQEDQAAVMGMPMSIQNPDSNAIEPVRYRPCPVCKELMNRVNFAHCSHVIVDVCQKHGTWFDKDELRRIVEFIRAGGLNKARELEIQELERRRSSLANSTAPVMMDPDGLGPSRTTVDAVGVGLSIAALALRFLLKL